MAHWQTALFQHTVDIWRPTRTLGSDGQYSAATYSLYASGVSCYHNVTPSVSQPDVIGRMEQDNIFTLDEFWFDEAQSILEEDVIVEKTLLSDGSQSNRYGKGYMTRGDPRLIADTGPILAFGHKEIVAALMEQLPAGVS